MKVINLVGRLAIRTQPIELGYNDLTREKNYDYSYTSTPINILKVTKNHIVYNYEGTSAENIFERGTYILDKRWIDDNWTSYTELVTLCDSNE